MISRANAAGDGETIAVLRVREGARGVTREGLPRRIFSVVLSAIAEDLGVVATATDPKSGLAIPAPGDEHPERPEMIARPPVIYPVGVREKNGPLIAARTRLHNVRVVYGPREAC